MTATFKNDGSNNNDQLTSGKTMTLTVSGLKGKVTALNLNLHRNSSKGSGTLTASVGTTTIISKTISKTSITSSYKGYEYIVTNSLESSDDIVITLKSTENSLYCNTFTIVYEPTSTDPSKTATTLSFGEEYDGKTITKYVGDENVYSIPATLSPSIEGAKITYESSDPNVVDVDEKGDIMLMATAPGTATITASYAGNDTYAAASASYNISVIDPNIKQDVFDFTGDDDYGSGVEKTSEPSSYVTEDKTWVSGNVTMVTSGKYRWWKKTNALRFYGGSFTLTVPEGYHITSVVLSCNTTYFNPNIGSYKDGKWIGNANSVKFSSTESGKGKDLTTITVTYAPDATLTTAASSFATYSCDYAVDYSAAGLKAYAVKLDEANNKVVYTEINGTVAAATPVLLQGEASTPYTLAPSTAKATTVDTDLLMSDGSVVAADNLYYGFATVNGISGFKLVQNGVTIPAKKGYLKLTNAISDAKAFYAFNGETTGINKAVSENNFDENAPRYNVSGQRVDKSFKGLVIINGKKYILK